MIRAWLFRWLLSGHKTGGPAGERRYIYIHDLDGYYKAMYKETYDLLPAATRERMLT